MSEPIPIAIPVLDLDGPPSVPDGPSDDVAIAEVLADVLAQVVAAGADVVRDIVTQRGVPQGGPSDRLLEASAGLTIEAVRTMGTWFAAFERSAADLATTTSVGRSVVAHGRSTWERTKGAHDDAAGEALRAVVEAVVEQIDLTTLVQQHVDLNAVVSDVDLDAVVAGLDVNAIAARIDVGALIDRLDLTALAAAVIDELDIPELIRQASSEATSDELGTLRLRSVDADRAMQRAVDRILRRRDAG